jgi:hypothetical protein
MQQLLLLLPPPPPPPPPLLLLHLSPTLAAFAAGKKGAWGQPLLTKSVINKRERGEGGSGLQVARLATY